MVSRCGGVAVLRCGTAVARVGGRTNQEARPSSVAPGQGRTWACLRRGIAAPWEV